MGWSGVKQIYVAYIYTDLKSSQHLSAVSLFFSPNFPVHLVQMCGCGNGNGEFTFGYEQDQQVGHHRQPLSGEVGSLSAQKQLKRACMPLLLLLQFELSLIIYLAGGVSLFFGFPRTPPDNPSLLSCSHFLYPSKHWKSGDVTGDDSASTSGDGKYELLTVANDLIADEIRSLMARSESTPVPCIAGNKCYCLSFRQWCNLMSSVNFAADVRSHQTDTLLAGSLANALCCILPYSCFWIKQISSTH